MDEQIQSILDEATKPQNAPGQISASAGDPVDSILQEAGVSPQTPPDVSNARSEIGSQKDNGYCQRFAEKITNSPNHYGSANEAWNDYIKQGKAYADISKAPQGALIYYQPDQSNGNFGHVAVTDGSGNQIGATDNGVEQMTVDQWMQQTGQKPLGYVIP